MVYYKIPFASEGMFTYPEGCILLQSFTSNGYVYCKFQTVTEVGEGWVSVTETEFNNLAPTVTFKPLLPTESVTATSATLSGGKVVLETNSPVNNGTEVKFTAPCACSSVSGGISVNGVTYAVKDRTGATIAGKNLWATSTVVAVILDTVNKVAYLQESTNISADDVKSGALPIERGGTGASDAATARANLGVTPETIGAAKSSHVHSASDITSGSMALNRGGTGATNGATGLKNLFAAGATVLSANQYGTTLPAAGTAGRIFFKKV